MTESAREKESALVKLLSELDSVMVAYSGGVDSSLLAYYARKVLGKRASIVIAVSPSLASDELSDARVQAEKFGWDLMEIETNEVEKPEYQRNDGARCYFCKSTLFEAMDRMASKLGISHLAYGANVDDMSDYRPGHRAAKEFAVLSPLQQVGLNKEEIRALARDAQLTAWDRPQSACLSSRFPTFEKVTAQKLGQVEAAERALRALGFRQLRVRHHTCETEGAPRTISLARIELDLCELARISEEPELKDKIAAELKRIGYTFVTIDLEGYRRGSGNVMVPVTVANPGRSEHG